MQKTHQANYDAANKLSSLYNCLANGAPLAYFDYQYDEASRITGCRREDGTQIYYQYDPASRLTGETWYEPAAMQPIYSFAWDYDLAGNRIHQNYNDQQTYYFYNPGNTLIRKQELGEDPIYYHYDSRGNCTVIQESDGSSYFSYNYANLVTDIRFKSGVSNYFFYDSRLRRYALQDSDGLRYFTWDSGGLNLLYEKDPDGNVVAEYTHGYTPVAGIGSLVAAKKNVGGATYYQYPAYDHRGSVVRLSDESGLVTAYYAYNAWGMPLVKQESPVGNRFTWQSNWIELKDSGGELLLAPARLYSTVDGWFLQRDLLGFVDVRKKLGYYKNSIFPEDIIRRQGGQLEILDFSLNLYEAFGSSPYVYNDPLGLFWDPLNIAIQFLSKRMWGGESSIVPRRMGCFYEISTKSLRNQGSSGF